ncbi:protein kinase [Planotetraspora sp. A-T 1434]|uniref:serine/threonine-protein kinase n=1 Tax=Planotetraspora sp. A-T 1434 TaxID=2979219 RepID=UPI0021C23876|nr:serine/threonine-protein kinase [Planotetraspora sp. A-T 1434]MCT9931096.1 protein kinase [Planotetraspora sp. A-T 1434]
MDLLAGRYRLVERLGEGGGGTVWRAADEVLRREVAVKQLRTARGLSEAELADLTARAIREARAAGRLSHPSIVMVHDVVRHAGGPWIVMDLVPGRSLDKIVHAEGPLPVDRVAAIGLSVLGALEAAHAHGILHRDVKPGNVLIGPDGQAMLTDFGIAAFAGKKRDAEAQSSAGSPAYMAPERFRGEPDGPASDLWSLGATLYTAVEGHPPFQRDLAAAVVAAVLLHEPRPMVRASPELARLVLALLGKDPARRPPHEVVRQALGALAGPPKQARAVRPRPRRTVRTIAGGVLLGAVVVAVGVAVGLGAWRLASEDEGDAGSGRFAAAPDPCRSLTGTQIRDLLGAQPDAEPSALGCRWAERRGGRTVTVSYEVPPASQGAGGADVARADFAGRRTAQAREAGTGLHDQPGVADEAFARDVADPASGTAGTTVWFRLSNIIVEVAYRRSGGGAATPDDRRTAVRAAELVSIGLG